MSQGSAMMEEMRSYVEKLESTYRVGGTRVTLDSIVYAFREGLTAASIRDSFPVLTLEEVYGAITFYLANQPEIDKAVAENEKRSDRLRQESQKENAESSVTASAGTRCLLIRCFVFRCAAFEPRVAHRPHFEVNPATIASEGRANARLFTAPEDRAKSEKEFPHEPQKLSHHESCRGCSDGRAGVGAEQRS